MLYGACTVRSDFLQPYRSALPYTPALAELGREGVVFRAHTTETGQSGIAFASLITGTQSDRHGIYHHPSTLADDNLTLAEVFEAAGWETRFWNGQPMASATLGYGQGVAPEHVFDREHPFQPKPTPFAPGALDGMAGNDAELGALLEHLAADDEARAFVQVFFTASHEPYHQYVSPKRIAGFCARHPQESRGVTVEEIERWLPVYEEHRHGLNWDFPAKRAELGLSEEEVERLAAVLEVAYAACIEQLDGLFGRFTASIEAAGLGEETLLCFTSDHGEVLWRDDALFPWTHGMGLEPEELEVPWILRGPGLEPGEFEGITRSIDVFPTLLGLCGLPVPSSVEGVNLAPALRGETAEPVLVAWSHNSTLGERRLKRFAEMGILHSVMPRPDPTLLWTSLRRPGLFARRRHFEGQDWEVQIFDPRAAPDEAHAEIARELESYQQRLVDGFARERGPDLGLEQELELLRSLGYVR